MPGWLIIALVVWHALACAVSFAQYGIDKRRARMERFRISEMRLHLFDLLGGWPGGWLGRHVFGHKTSKTSFVIVFWITMAVHVGTVATASYLVIF